MYLGRLVELADAHAVRRPRHPYTRMLLDAIPDMHMSGRARTPVQGEVPNPLNPPTGCAFHPRCPHANDRCVNVICSVQAEWCNMIQTVFARTTGIKVNMSLKGSGEALAQLIAERANPKTDIWFGGTGDPHLQAAEQGLSLEYKSPPCRSCTPGRSSRPRQQAASRRWASTTTPSCWPRRRCRCPSPGPTCSSPVYKGEIQVANPASSGTAYTMIATLVQLMGEDKAFDYMKALHKNIAPTRAAAPGRSRPWRAARPRCRSASCTTARARPCRAFRWPPSRRPKAPVPRSVR
jgi:oligopeptide/dipeptide ABC transporter ATP-binding protein